MDPRLLLNVDEITLVIWADKTTIESIEDWPKKAENIIAEFARLADLENTFGSQTDLEDKLPQGYSKGYQYGNNPFYFAVAYHPLHVSMGIIIKFSAYSWSVYCRRKNTNVKRFLHSVKSDLYKMRLSRIDFAVDYMNWDLSVDDIYQNLISNHLEIQDYKGKKNRSTLSGFETDGIADTFYVGSKKTGTRLFLRVYDKKQEQLENRGFRLQEAIELSSWTRFEAVFRGKYAHDLTNIIMATNEMNLPDLIADKVAEKYRFYDLGQEKYTDFSTALIEKPKRHFERLRLESPRDNSLIGSLLHLVNSSGLFSTLYKCDEIWGNETSTALLKHLQDIYKDDYEPNDDARLWLKKHKNTMKKQSLEEDLEILDTIRTRSEEEKLSA